jgi:Ni/Fe-hydrogenase 1 B-type cytochrome subunit
VIHRLEDAMNVTNEERRRIYDVVLRSLHWWNAAAIATLLATGWGSELFEHGASERTVWAAHVYAGYGLIVGLVARIVWGLVGPRHARFTDMWHPRVWREALTRFRFPAHRWGHDPIASAVYLAVYGMLAVLAVTGLALAATERGAGPLAGTALDQVWLGKLFHEPHEFFANFIAAFIVVHVCALWVHQRFGGVPVAQSMWTGVQVRPGGEAGHA